jgi:serine/threonine-protein kinase
MQLSPGQMLSHYRLAEKIGEGGMGFVWRAEDTVLGRDVALKFLPAGFDTDPDRLARFEREARFLASLNHANIAAIHGLDEAEGRRFLVLELVPGMSLEERIKKGSLTLDNLLKISRDIALALEAAHEKGVIHRDLKPGNVQVTPKGDVKVLDFGLAKAFGATVAVDEGSQQLTVTMGTGKHTVLGTTPYMSPEQASAGPVDKRTDIWAFGCILYQLLTGRRAFMGETVSSTIAAIHGQEPRWEDLPDGVPPRVHELLRRCLTKDPDRRLHDIADARIEIEDALAGRDWVVPAEQSVDRPASRAKLIFATAGILAGVLLTSLVFMSLTRSARHTGSAVVRSVVIIPPGQRLLGGGASVAGMSTPVALSPDGTLMVYAAETSEGTRLYVRPLDRFESSPIPGTEDAFAPFFSPDGQWVAFFHYDKLRKVSLASGAMVTICETPSTSQSLAPAIQGAAWGSDGTIVFAAGARSWGSPSGTASGLFRVSADGGTAEVLTSPDPEKGELGHWWPQILPDGLGVLYTVWGTATGDSRVELLSLNNGESHTVLEDGSGARYFPTGHLVYSQSAELVAVTFDPVRLAVTFFNDPATTEIYTSPRSGLAYLTVSDSGSLAYIPQTFSESVLMLVDRDGRANPLVSDSAAGFVHPRFSPDGRRVVVDAFIAGKRDIWGNEPVADLDARWKPRRVRINEQWLLANGSRAGRRERGSAIPHGGESQRHLVVSGRPSPHPRDPPRGGRTRYLGAPHRR